jgi:hypothetical protein
MGMLSVDKTQSNDLELGLLEQRLIQPPKSLKGGGRFLMMKLRQQPNQTYQQQAFNL